MNYSEALEVAIKAVDLDESLSQSRVDEVIDTLTDLQRFLDFSPGEKR